MKFKVKCPYCKETQKIINPSMPSLARCKHCNGAYALNPDGTYDIENAEIIKEPKPELPPGPWGVEYSFDSSSFYVLDIIGQKIAIVSNELDKQTSYLLCNFLRKSWDMKELLEEVIENWEAGALSSGGGYVDRKNITDKIKDLLEELELKS